MDMPYFAIVYAEKKNPQKTKHDMLLLHRCMMGRWPAGFNGYLCGS